MFTKTVLDGLFPFFKAYLLRVIRDKIRRTCFAKKLFLDINAMMALFIIIKRGGTLLYNTLQIFFLYYINLFYIVYE
jgi:hypothetical protein